MSFKQSLIILTILAGPAGLFLTAAPLANVDMDGKSVPLSAISKSLGGCLQEHKSWSIFVNDVDVGY